MTTIVRVFRMTMQGRQFVGIHYCRGGHLSFAPDVLLLRNVSGEVLGVPAFLRHRHGLRVDPAKDPLAWLEVLRYRSSTYLHYEKTEQISDDALLPTPVG